MAGVDVEALLQPLSDGAPCGENLEYDPEFDALERAATGKPERVMGSEVIEAEPPEWRTVLQLSLALFDRTRDLRVAVRLSRALLATEGFGGFRDGLTLISRLLDEQWDNVHPQLDPSDDNDPTLRVNAVAEIASAETVLKEVRLAPLAQSPGFGIIRYRDVALASGEMKPLPGVTPKDMSEIKAVFQECNPTELVATTTAVKDCLARLKAIDKTLANQVSAASSVDFAPALSLINGIAKFLDARVTERGLMVAPATADEAADTETPANGGEGPAPAARSLSDKVTSRDQVIQLLDRICDYYAAFEPSSPVPLFLRRAQRLVTKDFIDVLRDIAPDAVAQAEAVRGREGA